MEPVLRQDRSRVMPWRPIPANQRLLLLGDQCVAVNLQQQVNFALRYPERCGDLLRVGRQDT